MYIYIYTYTYIYTYIYTYVYIYIIYIHIKKNMFVHAYMCKGVCMYVCISAQSYSDGEGFF